MQENIVVRRVRPEDAETIGAIAAEQWKVIFDGFEEQIGKELLDIWYPNAVENRREGVSRCALDPEHCLVTEVDGVVAGFVTFQINTIGDQLVGALSNNAVSSAYKGRGIAGRQYEAVFEIMRERGCVGVSVMTGLDDAHASARRAYEKDGFTNVLEDITYFKKL